MPLRGKSLVPGSRKGRGKKWIEEVEKRRKRENGKKRRR